MENWRPLHPCSQHWGLGRLWTTRTWLCSDGGDALEDTDGLTPYIMGGSASPRGGDRLFIPVSNLHSGRLVTEADELIM